MKWKVSVSGNLNDLKELSKSFHDGDLLISSDDEGYYFEWLPLNSCEDYNAVTKRASELLKLINGAAGLALGSNPEIYIISIDPVDCSDKIIYDEKLQEKLTICDSETIQHLDFLSYPSCSNVH